MEKSPPRALGDAQIDAQLQGELKHWQLADGFIVRTYRTASWKGTMMVANAIGHLCEAAWHHPEMALSYAQVVVRLQTHDAAGITMRDIELARQIERFLQWQPAAEPGELTGPPADDERHAYLRYP